MTLCVLCPVYHPAGQPRMPQWPPCCDGCRQRTRTDLEGIPDAYARVPAALIPGSGGGEHVSGTRSPPLPVRIDALNLLGPGATWTRSTADQIGTLPPAVLLDQWCRDWLDTCDRRTRMPDPTVPAMVAWLLVGLDQALDEHPAIDEWAADLSTLARTLRGVTDGGRLIHHLPVQCPSCAVHQLYRENGASYVECGNCHRLWTEDEYRRLCVVLAAEAKGVA